jgi:hypothetical protein
MHAVADPRGLMTRSRSECRGLGSFHTHVWAKSSEPVGKVNLLIQRYFSRQSAIRSPRAGWPSIKFTQSCPYPAKFFVEPSGGSPVKIGQGADK